MTEDDDWSVNLRRKGGFYQDADWYALQLTRKMPLVTKMLKELTFALPPLKEGRVCDLAAGNGNAAVQVKTAYPRVAVSVVEQCPYRIEQCRKRLEEAGFSLFAEYQHKIVLNTGGAIGEVADKAIPGSPYDAVVGSLALHTLVGHDADQSLIRDRYCKVFSLVFDSLKPGGHFIFGDHVELLPLYRQLRLMEDVGFMSIDVAWREDAYFVAGGRKPKAV